MGVYHTNVIILRPGPIVTRTHWRSWEGWMGPITMGAPHGYSSLQHLSIITVDDADRPAGSARAR